MNILILNAGTGWGGIESHSVTLSAALLKRGHRTIIACSEGGHVYRNAVECGLPVDNIRVLNACDLISIMKIIRLASKENIDIIVANLGKEYWPGAAAAKFLGKKIVFIRHQRDRIRKTTRWLINNYTHTVVAVSSAVEDALLASGISKKKIRVVHNAISLSRFDPSRIDKKEVRRELGMSEDDVLIGTVGKLHKGKGGYELLRAAGRIVKEGGSVKVLFVGEGPERDGLEMETKRLMMQGRILFTGIRTDVERMYAAMDIFALPSHNEGMPTVLVEAMAMNIPVIATPVGGVPEIVRSGENGLLIPVGDESALRDAILRYLTEKETAARLADNGRTTVELEFGDDMLAERFEEIFTTLGIK